MRIYEAFERMPLLIGKLTAVWESSVWATHGFLSNAEIDKIKEYVPKCLNDVKHLIIAEREQGKPVAFMGAENSRLEMLFLLPEERGHGLGKQLLKYGICNYRINELTVNEQNPQAVDFYRHMGFETYKRTDCDEEGNPYPLLYMKLTEKF